MPGETSPSRSYMPENVPQGCGRKRGSRCGAKRRRSESNRRIEVLQTSALPLGYGAGRNVNSQLTTSSARVEGRIVSPEWTVVNTTGSETGVVIVRAKYGSAVRPSVDSFALNGHVVP